jgi:hypothetical protein
VWCDCPAVTPHQRNQADSNTITKLSNLEISDSPDPETSYPSISKMAEPQTFNTLPILPLSAALDPSTKPQFLSDLRSALLNVGFLYLSETGLPDFLIKDVVTQCGDFFEKLPQEEKEAIEMKHEKSFLGWSKVSCNSVSV